MPLTTIKSYGIADEAITEAKVATDVTTISGTSHTLDADDADSLLVFTNASAITLTVPANQKDGANGGSGGSSNPSVGDPGQIGGSNGGNGTSGTNSGGTGQGSDFYSNFSLIRGRTLTSGTGGTTSAGNGQGGAGGGGLVIDGDTGIGGTANAASSAYAGIGYGAGGAGGRGTDPRQGTDGIDGVVIIEWG